MSYFKEDSLQGDIDDEAHIQAATCATDIVLPGDEPTLTDCEEVLFILMQAFSLVSLFISNYINLH